MAEAVELRAAGPRDRPRVVELLRSAGLPVEDLRDDLEGFVVAERGGAVIGAGALEPHGEVALLRSLVVAPEERGAGVARALCDRLETDALRHGLDALYGLTETAEGYLYARGWESVQRDAAPPAIAVTAQFRSLCPSSARLLRWRPDDALAAAPQSLRRNRASQQVGD